MYFQEWASGLPPEPGCCVAMSGRAPGNLLQSPLPEAPNQTSPSQCAVLSVGGDSQTALQQGDMVSASTGSASSISSPDIDGSPSSAGLVPSLSSGGFIASASSGGLVSSPTALVPGGLVQLPAETFPATGPQQVTPTSASPPAAPGFSTQPPQTLMQAPPTIRPRFPFAFDKKVMRPSAELLFNQTRVYQAELMRRASTNTGSRYPCSSISAGQTRAPFNLAVSQFARGPGDIMMASGNRVQPDAAPKLTASVVRRGRASAKGNQILTQVKRESYRSLMCSLCNKMFNSQSGLQRHINTSHKDAKDKPFKCQECGKGFLSERTLKMHTNMHLGVYPYHCQFCNKGFPNQDNLKGHLASHTNVKEFRCEQCGQEFTYRTSLNQHVAKTHHLQ